MFLVHLVGEFNTHTVHTPPLGSNPIIQSHPSHLSPEGESQFRLSWDRWCLPSFSLLPSPTSSFIVRHLGSLKFSSLSIVRLFGLEGFLSAKWCMWKLCASNPERWAQFVSAVNFETRQRHQPLWLCLKIVIFCPILSTGNWVVYLQLRPSLTAHFIKQNDKKIQRRRMMP